MHFRVQICLHGKCFNIPPFFILLCSMMKEGNRNKGGKERQSENSCNVKRRIKTESLKKERDRGGGLKTPSEIIFVTDSWCGVKLMFLRIFLAKLSTPQQKRLRNKIKFFSNCICTVLQRKFIASFTYFVISSLSCLSEPNSRGYDDIGHHQIELLKRAGKVADGGPLLVKSFVLRPGLHGTSSPYCPYLPHPS